ncbi:MAG TPA: tetratricopeptide repeat protein [Candidatus Aquicultor sp.]|jgi:tetratricopeptide (TPR) repeat protein
MVKESKRPTLNNTLLVAGIVVLVLALGVTAIIVNNNANDSISAKEAAAAKAKGLELYRQGKWDSALSELKKAVDGNPNDMTAQFKLAFSYEQKGMLDDAFKRYEEILKLNKSSADAHYSIGRILVEKRDLDKGIAELETATKLNPSFTSAHAALADAYFQKNQYANALATYTKLEKLIGKNDTLYLSRIHTAKGQILKQGGKDDEARREFTLAVQLDKNNKEAAAALK